MKRIKSFLKQLFCRHDFEICRQSGPFFSLGGEQLYKVCKRCGKVEKYIYREYEGMGYK